MTRFRLSETPFDVAAVRAGLACGVVLADTNDVKPGDQLEVYEVEMRERTL